MLDEVRKFGLFLNLSHQRFGQLNEEVEDAILANCRIKTVFGGLRTEDSRRMAEELFIGKLDPKKIKASIYQTKHWYKYTREKVYSQSKSYSESDGTGYGTGSGSSSGSQTANLSGQTFLPPSDEFFTGGMYLDASNLSGLSESTTSGLSSVDSSSEFESESHSESWSESEGVADIPVFVPVPYQELSSVQYYTPEEQLLELTQALKLQQQRHCFIQLPNQETQPVLVPLVEDFYVSKTNFDWYVQKLADKAGAISPEEASRQISQAQQDLLQLKSNEPEPVVEAPRTVPDDTPQPTPPVKKGATIFDKLKKLHPDKDI
jgi:hypothetical protein